MLRLFADTDAKSKPMRLVLVELEVEVVSKGVLITRALLFGVYVGASEFWKLPVVGIVYDI